MEKNFEVAFTSAILIIIAVLPFVMVILNKRKRKKKFLQALAEIATQNHSQLGQNEIFGNFAIGFDETKNFVFFYKQFEDKEVKESVNLSEVQSCMVHRTIRTFKNEEGNQKVIDRLELCFMSILNDRPETKWEFFNKDVSTQLFGEVQLIEKWSKLINDQLKQKV